MIKNRVAIFLTLLCSLILIAVYAFYDKQQSTLNSHGSQSPSVQSELIIPVFLPQTGPLSVYGTWMESSMQLAAAQVNNLPNTKTFLHFKFFDTKGNPKETITAYQQSMALKKYPIIISSFSGPTMSLIPLTEKNNQILIATLVTHPEVTTKGNLVYRHFPNKGTGAQSLAREMISNKLNEAAHVYINDEGGLAEKRAFDSVYLALGGKITHEYVYAQTTMDFKDIIGAIGANEEKNIFLSGYGPAYGRFLKTMRDFGLSSNIFTSQDIIDPFIISIAGKPTHGSWFYNPMNESSERYLKYSIEYKERFGSEPPLYSGYTFDLPFILAKALHLSGGSTDVESLKNAINKIVDLPGVYQSISIGQDHDVKSSFWIYEVTANGYYKKQ